MKQLDFHPLANLFPLIEGEQFAELVADVQKNGVLEPVVLLNWQILDGRNRYLAAKAAGVDCAFIAFGSPSICRVEKDYDEHASCYTYTAYLPLPDDDDGIEEPFSCEYGGEIEDPVAFVISKNLKRRHLDESQRGMVAAKLANMVVGGREANSANLQNCSAPISQATAADMLNVSERTVSAAVKVKDEGAPELIDAVERGKISISAAADIATKPQDEQREIVARGEKLSHAKIKELVDEAVKYPHRLRLRACPEWLRDGGV